MKRQITLIAAAGLAFAWSCSLDEPAFGPETPGAEPYKVQISGDIDQQPATKVTTDGFCTGDEVGVYIVNYDGETPGKLKLEKNQADNVRFKYDGAGSWVSDYDVFYKDNDTKVDFYGYYPYAESLSSSSAAQTTSIEAYAFEVERDQSKSAEDGKLSPYEASDFLWAKTEKVTPTSSKVMMRFRHKMSSARVRFSMGTGWADEAEFAAVSKEVLVTNTVRKTTIDLSTGVVTPVGEAPLTGIIPMNDNGEFRAIVAPQTVEAGKNVLVITIGGGAPRYFAGTKDEATEYLPGKITTFELKVSKEKDTGEYEIELAGVSITAWEADNVSHGDDAREYVVIHNAFAGRLEETVVKRLEMDPTAIKNLKLTGSINADDYTFMRDKMTMLQRLNLKEVESLIDGVYMIPAEAFYKKKTLIKCFLPDKLERIGQYAFGDTSLSGTIILPEGLKYVNGFNGTKIINISFPSTLEEIGSVSSLKAYKDGAFSGCTSLMSNLLLPESIKIIGECAFKGSSISGVLNLPDSLESIGKEAFKSCGNLTGSLIIPNRIKEVESETFYNCGFNGILSLPDGLRTIGDRAFYFTELKGELHIPETVISIGSGAFAGTAFNSTIVFPQNILSIGSSAFSDCQRLTGTVTIPSSIISIPSSMFKGCTGIEGLILHRDVGAIESSAFENCHYIYSIVCEAKIPPIIAANSFNGVAKDNFTVEVPEASVAQYRNASNWSEFKRIAAHREFSISRSLLRTLNAEYSKTYVLRAPAGENWSVESKPEWVEVSPSSGTGKTDVTVTVNALAKGSANRSGEVVFLLEGKDYRSKMAVEQYDYQYRDGEVITLQKASKGKGVNIVLMGDCFDAKDISEGKYLQAIQDAYKYFFDIEPYLTYKDYFNVYGVFGMSPDSGMGTVNTIRESRFGSQYTLDEGVSSKFDETFAAASLTPIKDISTTLIVMVENSGEYGGSTYLWGDGSAVAIVSMSTDPEPYGFCGLIHHEAGGYGFGKLANESIYCNSFCPWTAEIKEMQSYGFYENVSASGDMHSVPWSHFIFDPQYSNVVDIYEGAYGYTRGVFRSEPTSCMNNNIPYYNAISREAMVKRIMKYAGEEYSFDNFKANDKESLPKSATKAAEQQENRFENISGSKSAGYNQMPPKFMGDKPSFKKN